LKGTSKIHYTTDKGTPAFDSNTRDAARRGATRSDDRASSFIRSSDLHSRTNMEPKGQSSVPTLFSESSRPAQLW